MGVFKSRRALLCSALVTMLIGLQSPPTHALALQGEYVCITVAY